MYENSKQGFIFAGINIFLDGYIPTENLRFRETALTFRVAEKVQNVEEKETFHSEYESMTKTLGKLLAINLKEIKNSVNLLDSLNI